MFFLGKELEKKNNVHYYFIHNEEVMNRTPFSKDTFFYFKEKIKKEKLHDVRDINFKFLNDQKNIDIDFNRLKEIEKKYTHFIGLNKQILSSQGTSTAYHDEFFYKHTTYEENLYWLLLNYDNSEKLFDKIKPDIIMDMDTGEIQRSIINEIAHQKKIIYVTMEYSRYKKFYLPFFSLGREQEKYFVKSYEKNKNSINLKKYIDEVKDFQNKTKIMSDMYQNTDTASYSFTFIDLIKLFYKKTYSFLASTRIFLKQKTVGKFSNTPFYSNIFKRILWNYVFLLRKFYLYSKFNKYFSSPTNEKYVYLPLHMMPESSTFVMAPMYVNEMSLIEAISKSLPIDCKLYVKEHQVMVGMRSLKFYKKANELYNVKIIKNNFYKDPKPLIQKSMCVISITGTSAFEASMLNKSSIVLGNSLHNVIPSIKIANSYNELESLMKQIDDNKNSYDNTVDCAAYLKTVEDLGTSIELNYLTKLCEKKIKSLSLSEKEENQFEYQLNELKDFYEKAVGYYKNN